MEGIGMLNWKKSMASIVVLFFVSCVLIPQVTIAKSEDTKESLITVELGSMEGKTVILHTNDMHGRVLYGQNGSLGIATVAALKIKLEKAGAQVITLDAGDTFRGTTIANRNQGEMIVQLMNTIGYDAMVSGNHDYEYGYEHLLELAKTTSFPILGANVIGRDTNQSVLKNRILLTRNGVTYGIFGLVTESTMTLNKMENVEGILLIDPVVCAKMEVAYLKSAGADVIIALTHVGIKEKEEINCIDLLTEVDGIDILIDGHSHSTLKDCQGVNPNQSVVYTSSGSYLNSIGAVVIDKDGTRTAYNLTEQELNALGIDPLNSSYGVEDPMLLKIQDLLSKAQLHEPASYQIMIGPTTVFLSFLPPDKEVGSAPVMTDAITDSVILMPKIHLLP